MENFVSFDNRSCCFKIWWWSIAGGTVPWPGPSDLQIAHYTLLKKLHLCHHLKINHHQILKQQQDRLSNHTKFSIFLLLTALCPILNET